MPLDFEQQTPKSINERLAADVKLYAPKSNPTTKNSFLYALVKGFSFRVFDFYQVLKKLKAESFPDTSTMDGELGRWGGYKKILQKPVSGASGTVIVTGEVGQTLPRLATATLSDVTYETLAIANVNAVKFLVKNANQSGEVITITTVNAHNLASDLSAIIEGMTDASLNGTFKIAVVSATEFTYTVEGQTGTKILEGDITATFNIAFVNVKVTDDSKVSGEASNHDGGVKLKLDGTVNVDDELIVAYTGLSGGADLETADEYKARVIEAYANPVANFNPSAIIQVIKQNVANATRVWVRPITPDVGEVTIYVAADNQNIIPSGEDLLQVANAVYSILPVNTPQNAVHVLSPRPKNVQFVFIDIEPSTAAMRAAINDRLKELFYVSSNIGETLKSETFRSTIASTVDANGIPLTDFSLELPISDIVLQPDEIIVLDTVVYKDKKGEAFIAVMFDGIDGRSNGKVDGLSQEITGDGLYVDIVLTGEFGGATVKLQQYDNAQQQWIDTLYDWDDEGNITGLTVVDGARFRLSLSSAQANVTDVAAAAVYS